VYITNFKHFLDEDGNIPKTMHKEARELASFLALVIDESTDYDSESGFETFINCFKGGCDGMIQSEILFDKNNEIHWLCPKCGNEGIISEWEECRWDNGRLS